MRILGTLIALTGVFLVGFDASAGWDPLQKAQRSAQEGARRFAAGDSLGAVEALLKAQAIAPDDPRIRMGLAEALYNNGEYRSSLGQYELAGDGEGEYGLDALYNAGNAAFAMGELEKALDFYTRALASGDARADLLHNLELAQKLLEQQQQQQQEQEGEKGDPQEGEEGDQQQQEQGNEGQEQQQEQGEEEQQEPQDGEQQQQEGDGEEEQEQQQEPATAQPDSMPPMPAMADSLTIPDGMTAEQAMRLLDALDHDEEELRRSIQRRLRRGEKESEHDW